MIAVTDFRDRRVAVMGLGRSGLAAARALMAGGAEVRAWDNDDARREAAAIEGVPVVDLTACDWSDMAALVLSPGIPHSFPAPHPVAVRALEAGCDIICDVDLLGRAAPRARFIGVTGTNGKSTVTALLGHILASAGVRARIGGNIGVPVLELDPPGPAGWYVLEMSSYQLERTFSIRFDIAILLNITPDHLDRHGGMAGYVAAKKRIFAGQGASDVAIVGVDDDDSRAIFDALHASGRRRVVPISAERELPDGVSTSDAGTLRDASGDGDDITVNIGGIPTLPGRHNRQNAAAAWAAARAAGLAPDEILKGIASYPGLPHRQQIVAVIDGVTYVNDSKATNAEAAAKALASYDAVYWIAGGRPKEGGIASLAPWFARIRHAFLIGEAAEGFARTLEGRVPYTISRTLASAVRDARDLAAGGEDSSVVLLSPACASFDQFDDYEARGRAFAELVADLPGRREGAASSAGEAVQ